jgi:hypothetical protein
VTGDQETGVGSPLAVGYHVTSDHDGPPSFDAMTLLEKLDEPWDTKGWALRHNQPIWLGRPLFTGQPSDGDLAQRITRVVAEGGRAQLGNEWNHPVEGWPGGGTPAGLDELVVTWWSVFHALDPGWRGALGWGAASPDMPMYRETFDLDKTDSQVADVCRAAGFLILHAYGPHSRIKNLVDEVHRRWPDKPLWLAEFNWGQGNPKPPGWEEGLLDLLSWLDCLRLRGTTQRAVVAATPFCWYWKDGPSDVDLRGTTVTHTMLRFDAGDRAGNYPPESSWPAPEPPPEPDEGDDVSLFAKKILTVWNLPPKPQTLVDWCGRCGVTAVEIKVCDGDSMWGVRRNVTPEYVTALRSAGIEVYGWGYHYCDFKVNAGDRGNGVPVDEGRAAARQCKRLGLPAYTWDLEIESEGPQSNQYAQQMFDAFDDEMDGESGVEEGAHVWPYRRGHEGYAWTAIGQRVDVVRPMTYPDDWDAVRSYSDLEIGPWIREVQARGGHLAAMTGITDPGATADRLAADWAVHKAAGTIGLGVWEYSGLPGLPGVLDWLRGLEIASEVPDGPVDPSGDLAERFAGYWQDLVDFRAAVERWRTDGDPDLEQMKLGVLTAAGHPMNATVALAKKLKGVP